LPLNALDAVPTLTPASAATSVRVVALVLVGERTGSDTGQSFAQMGWETS
jgi:hypothetical protein